ncbi:unnamed protein product, partial [Didymodactylos carnosus]
GFLVGVICIDDCIDLVLMLLVDDVVAYKWKKIYRRTFVDDNPLAINEDEEIQTGDEGGDDDNNVQQQQLTAVTVNTLSTRKKIDFKGMRIKDKIDPEQEKCYFRVNIGGQDKYMHKQTACWLFMTSKNRLSSDRLRRVQEAGRQE